MTVSQTYDPARRAASRVYDDLEGVKLDFHTASYDPVGNRIAVEELDGSFEYAYDPSRQLIGEVRSGAVSYACTFTYDGAGNRLNLMTADGSLTSYTYNPASELLTVRAREAVTTFSYDPAGDTVSEQSDEQTVDFTWDGEKRLVEVDDGESVETNAYDATGLRRRLVCWRVS